MASGAAAQVSDPSHGLRRHRTPGLPSGHGSPPGAAGRNPEDFRQRVPVQSVAPIGAAS